MTRLCEIKILPVGTLQKVLAVHPETGNIHLNETYNNEHEAVSRKKELELFQEALKNARTEESQQRE